MKSKHKWFLFYLGAVVLGIVSVLAQKSYDRELINLIIEGVTQECTL